MKKKPDALFLFCAYSDAQGEHYSRDALPGRHQAGHGKPSVRFRSLGARLDSSEIHIARYQASRVRN